MASLEDGLTDDVYCDCVVVIVGHGEYRRDKTGKVVIGELSSGKVNVVNAVTPGCCIFTTQSTNDEFIDRLSSQSLPTSWKNLKAKLKSMDQFSAKCKVREEATSQHEKLKQYPARFLESSFLDTFLDKTYFSDELLTHRCICITKDGVSELTNTKTSRPTKSSYLEKVEMRNSNIILLELTCNEGDDTEIVEACIKGKPCGGKLKTKRKLKRLRRKTYKY